MSRNIPKYVKESRKQREDRVREEAKVRNNAKSWSPNGNKHDHKKKRRKFKMQKKQYLDV